MITRKTYFEFGHLEGNIPESGGKFTAVVSAAVALSLLIALVPGRLGQLAQTQPVFDGYKAARYSKKYLAEHEEELDTYRTAQQEKA